MLDRIGDIDEFAIDTGRFQCFIKQPACGADERAPTEIFAITGLFANKHNSSIWRPFSKYGLCSILPQVACLAGAGGSRKTFQVTDWRTDQRWRGQCFACHKLSDVWRLSAGILNWTKYRSYCIGDSGG